jgi:CheY-like chemotaxis protein
MDCRRCLRQIRLTAPVPELNRVFCRVLIVDDNDDLAEAMSKVLTIWGFHTATASDGRRALEKARTFQPEVIVLDIGLPDMDGYEVASTLREETDIATPHIIAMSANSPETRSPRARAAGFDHFLVKPIDPEVLLRALSDGSG